MFCRCRDLVPGALALGIASLPLSLAAIPTPIAAQAVVQPAPDPAAAELRAALQKLGADPGDLSALLAAGHASVKLADIDAAEAFFVRALDVAPDDPEVTIGLALVSLRREDAAAALTRFAQAEAAGGDLAPWAGERGLAFDLAGANTRAQALYKQALAREADDEIIRRLALSYAITGDGPASEAMLLPLMQRRDLAAYRARAFSLAILGRDEEAVAIARTMLPARVANRLTPYLRYMPRLTAAQQAAAANLGAFPEAGRIGRDDPALAAFAQGQALAPNRPAAAAPAGSRLVPEGEALGNRTSADPLAPPPRPAAEPKAPPALAEPAPAPAPEPAPALGAEPAPAPAPEPSPAKAEPAPVVAAQAEPPKGQSFEDAFEVYGPVDEPADEPAKAAPGPVAAPEPPPAAEPAAPTHPARFWVQLGVGRNISAFAYDWRKRVREAGGLLDDLKPYRVPARGTNRLLTGPFESAEKAREMVSKLKASGVDALRYISAEGEEVVPLR